MPEAPPVPLPDLSDAQVVVPAPGPGPGNWAGAASAVLVDGTYWLAYRIRRPLDAGRGVAVEVARSADGVAFEVVTRVEREQLGCESFEKPALVRLADGRWRLYLSCATPGSKHWWVDSLTADSPAELAAGKRAMVLPGDDTVGVKDPVVERRQDGWHLWLCCHPLTEADAEDRMTTRYLTSEDGLAWVDRGEALAGQPGAWDARGARVTTVVSWSPLVVLYDGRPDAESNWHERTGIATGQLGGRLTALAGEPLRSPWSDGACRYATAVPLPDGRVRFYVEVARPDGAHDLVTSVWTNPGSQELGDGAGERPG